LGAPDYVALQERVDPSETSEGLTQSGGEDAVNYIHTIDMDENEKVFEIDI